MLHDCNMQFSSVRRYFMRSLSQWRMFVFQDFPQFLHWSTLNFIQMLTRKIYSLARFGLSVYSWTSPYDFPVDRLRGSNTRVWTHAHIFLNVYTALARLLVFFCNKRIAV